MDQTTCRRVALAFLAHPDDAEFLCGATLAALAELGWEIHIATATAGDLGTMTEDRWQISARRTAEARSAAALLGATYHCLGESDCMVCFDKPTLQKCYDLFRQISPSLVFAHPAEDYMLDHQIVHQLARAASFIFAAPNVSAHPRQPQAAVPYLYYCDPVEAIDIRGQRIRPTVYVDATVWLDKKRQLLACHESQRSWLLAHHGMDEYLESMQRHAALRGAEVGTAAAEAFVQHRGHAYPADDLLGRLLPCRQA